MTISQIRRILLIPGVRVATLSPAMATVLVIEDDEDMCTASNGHDGLRQLRERRPCAVVLDLMMPVMDGLTFLRERSSDPQLRNIPVLCVTAGGSEMVAHAKRLGARECLHKPTDFDELCDLVTSYCSSRTARSHSNPRQP